MKKTLVSYLLGALTPFFVIAIICYLGIFDVSATTPPGDLESALSRFIVDQSIARHATDQVAPKPTTDILRDGLEHYRANCIMCHGATGVKPGELAKGLNPVAPRLEANTTQRRSDGELYQIVSHGIRMTGMPGFAPTHNNGEIWNIVTFLRHLPKLTEQEKAFLAGEAQEKAHHHSHDIEQ